MTTTPAIDIGIPGDQRQAIAAGLARLLADTYVLYGKASYWNVTGPMFSTSSDVHGAIHRAGTWM